MLARLPIRWLRQIQVQKTPNRLLSLFAIGFLLVNIALAYLALQRQLAIALYLFLGIGIFVLFLRWPPLGLIVASLAGVVVPFLGPSGLNITMILVGLLLGLWLLDMVVYQRQIKLVPSRPLWPLIAFLVVSIISFGIGQLHWFTFVNQAPLGAQLGGLSLVVLSVGTFLLVANQMHDMIWLKRMTWAFLAMAAFSFFTKSILPELGITAGEFLPSMGSVFIIWLVAIAFSQALINHDLHPIWRFALGGLVLVNIYFHFFLRFDFKSGWVPLFVCIATIIGFRSWRVGLVLFPIGLFLIVILTSGSVASENYSLTTRLEAWTILLQIIKVNPVLGLGFANYYWYTPLFPIQGYDVSFNSHNNYVDIVAQTGLVGLSFFLFFLWRIGKLGWQLRERAPSGFALAYVYGALGGLAGMIVSGMLGDWVLPFFYNVGLNGFRSSMLGWLFLGGLVSLEQMLVKEAPG
jgi:hypothetical protein